MIHAAGGARRVGAPVLGRHDPGDTLKQFAGYGIDGVEAFYVTFTAEQTSRSTRAAASWATDDRLDGLPRARARALQPLSRVRPARPGTRPRPPRPEVSAPRRAAAAAGGSRGSRRLTPCSVGGAAGSRIWRRVTPLQAQTIGSRRRRARCLRAAARSGRRRRRRRRAGSRRPARRCGRLAPVAPGASRARSTSSSPSGAPAQKRSMPATFSVVAGTAPWKAAGARRSRRRPRAPARAPAPTARRPCRGARRTRRPPTRPGRGARRSSSTSDRRGRPRARRRRAERDLGPDAGGEDDEVGLELGAVGELRRRSSVIASVVRRTAARRCPAPACGARAARAASGSSWSSISRSARCTTVTATPRRAGRARGLQAEQPAADDDRAARAVGARSADRAHVGERAEDVARGRGPAIGGSHGARAGGEDERVVGQQRPVGSSSTSRAARRGRRTAGAEPHVDAGTELLRRAAQLVGRTSPASALREQRRGCTARRLARRRA